MNPDLEREAELRECAACRRYATLTRYAVGIGNPFNRGLVELCDPCATAPQHARWIRVGRHATVVLETVVMIGETIIVERTERVELSPEQLTSWRPAAADLDDRQLAETIADQVTTLGSHDLSGHGTYGPPRP